MQTDRHIQANQPKTKTKVTALRTKTFYQFLQSKKCEIILKINIKNFPNETDNNEKH